MNKSFLFCALFILLTTLAWGDNTYCISVFQSSNNNIPNFTYSGHSDEHVLNGFVVPGKGNDQWPMYWVGCKGAFYGSNLGNNNAKSANAYLYDMPLSENRSNKIGYASGAVGTLHIYDNSNQDNLYVSFIPDGYGLVFGIGENWNSLPFKATDNGNVFITDRVIVSAEVKTYQYYVGLKTQTGYAYSENYWVYTNEVWTECNGRSKTLGMNTMGVTTDGTSWKSGDLNAVAVGTQGYFRIWLDRTEQNWLCHFVPDYTVRLNSNFPDGQVDQSEIRYVSYEVAQPGECPFIVPDAYQFAGWNTAADGSGTHYDTTSEITSDLTLYAEWTPLTTFAFEHSNGKSGRDYIYVNGHKMQDVHAYERTIYLAPNQEQRLYRPDYLTYYRYIRWFNYDTDGAAGSTAAAGKQYLSYTPVDPSKVSRQFSDNKGDFYLQIQGDLEKPNFTAPADFTSANYPNGITIACDQGAYNDAPMRLTGAVGANGNTPAATRHEVFYFIEENKTVLTAAALNTMAENATKNVIWFHPTSYPEGWVAYCDGDTILHGWDFSPTPNTAFINAAINWRLGGGKTQMITFQIKRLAGGFQISNTTGTKTNYLYVNGQGELYFSTDVGKATLFQFDAYGYNMDDEKLPSLKDMTDKAILLRANGRHISSMANVVNNSGTKAMPVETKSIVLPKVQSRTEQQGNTYNYVEPTLSQRLIFHIYPADKMANALSDKNSPENASVNKKYLYWGIRCSVAANNFPLVRHEDYTTTLTGTKTIQLISPLDYLEGGYVLPKKDVNGDAFKSLAGTSRNWGTIKHLRDVPTWFTTGNGWENSHLTMTLVNGYYRISCMVNATTYYLAANSDRTAGWVTATSNATDFVLEEMQDPNVQLGEHVYKAGDVNTHYLFALKAKNGYYLYANGNWSQPAAVQMNNTTNDEWLEEQVLIAPTGQTIYLGPQLQYTSQGNTNSFPYYQAGYFINSTSPQSCYDTNGTWIWKKDGQTITPQKTFSGRFTQLEASPVTQSGMHTYTLQYKPNGSYTVYNICKIIVDYRDQVAVGPSSTLSYKAVETADLLGEETFNYNLPGTSTSKFYTEPVPFDESSYGFYYGTLDHYSTNGYSQRTYPYWGEYGILNQTNKAAWGIGFDIANHDETADLNGSDPQTGYMLYVDGSQIPGDLFSLRVQDLNLCAGTKMYCSAWVASVTGVNSSRPNLNFEVTAVNHDGQSKVITTFLTGELANDGQWKHILFPVTYNAEFGEIDQVEEFRVRITNLGENAAGNDFVIDDIRFYAKRAPILPIQAGSSACLGVGQKETVPTYLRIDYAQLLDEEGDQDYFYRWYTSDYTTLTAAYYGGNGTTHGSVSLRRDVQESADLKFDTYKAFDEEVTRRHAAGTLKAFYAYVWETADDGQSRYFLYIVQPLSVEANHTYRAAVAGSPDDLAAATIASNTCAVKTSLTIIGGAQILVDGNVATDEVTPCGNRLYTLDVQMTYLVKDTETNQYRQESYMCAADWLLGDENYINSVWSSGDHTTYGAEYATIAAAIRARTNPTEEQRNLLRHLVENDLLTLNQKSIKVYPNASALVSTLYYTAFPRSDGESHSVAVCEEPQVVMFHLPDEAQRNGIGIGETTAGLPNAVSTRVRTVRATREQLQGTEFRFPIHLLGTLSGYTITRAQLYDAEHPENVYDVPVKMYANATGEEQVESVTGDCYVGLDCSALREIEIGNKPTFLLDMTIPEKDAQGNDVSECKVTYGYFNLMVCPNEVTWKTNATTWNNDASWVEGYAPLAATRVIFPAQANTVPTADQHFDSGGQVQKKGVYYERGAQDYITYEIGYTPFACKDIYVPEGASVMNQTRLAIGGQAFIDMPFAAGKWQMTAFPIEGVVSGDLFIPESESTKAFETAAISTPADRYLHPFYQNLYNASVTNTTGYGSCEETVESSTWLTNAQYGEEHGSGHTANGMAIPYGFAEGKQAAGAFLLDQTSGSNIVRLPKKADATYSYYDKNTHEWIGYLSDEVQRSNDPSYGHLLYTTSGQSFALHGNTASRIFLFGNPTLAYIDMAAFMTTNSSVLTGTYHALKGDSYVTSLADVSANGEDLFYLPPYSAVLVEKTGDAATSVAVTVNNEMLAAEPVSVPAAPQRQGAEEANSVIRIAATSGGFTTYAMAEESVMASNLYDEQEDADVFLMAPAHTPFVIYTTADRHALAIHRHRSLSYLPLCFYSHQEGVATKVKTTLTFSGDDSYLSEWDLQLLGSNRTAALCNGLSVTLSMYSDGTPTAALVHSRPKVPTNIDDVCTENRPHVYTQGGRIVCCADAPMHHIEVFSPAGQLLHNAMPHDTYHEVSVPGGVYIVRVDGNIYKVYND